MRNIAKSRRDMITPKPMEVDKVKAEWDRRTTRAKTTRETARFALWARAAGANDRAKEPASHAGRSATEQRSARTKAEEKPRKAMARGSRRDGLPGRAPAR